MTRRLPAKRYLSAGIAASCAFALTPVAFGLSFGGERVLSFLGQPLRLAIPLLGATGDSLDAGCFRVVTPSRADGLTVISQARVELQTSSSPPLLIVRSSRVVDDPVVRVSIEAGCDSPIRRDYTILLDPPPLQSTENNAPRAAPIVTPPATVAVPVTAMPSAVTSNTTAGSRQSARDRAERNVQPRAQPSSASSTDAKRSPRATSRSDRNTAKAASADEKSLRIDSKTTASQADQLRVQDGAGAVSNAVGDASLAALAVPRLKIASDLPSFDAAPQGAPRTMDELQAAIASERRARLLNAPIEEDLSPRLEADLVVAKRRLAELQSQLTAAGLVAKSETPGAAGTKSATTAATVGRTWNWREWLWVPGAALVLGLLGFLLRQRRAQRETQKFSTATVPTLRDEDVFEPTRPIATEVREAQMAEPVAAVAAPAVSAAAVATPLAAAAAMANPLLRQPSTLVAEREASDRLNNPLFQLRDTSRHVDVTELSQVTDEAQVYVDLGRSDQAIEILRDHIENQQGERDSPAAWLMIFDLYRRTNNRAGYDELAPQFRTHFNGRMPDWDNYGHELALDDGLEAFPHLVAMLQRDWGTSEARKFLEELLYDNRGGSRLGFSLAAYRDILLLLQVHEAFDGQPSELASKIDWESRGANDDDGTPKWDLSLEMLDPPKVGELESFLRNRPPDDKS